MSDIEEVAVKTISTGDVILRVLDPSNLGFEGDAILGGDFHVIFPPLVPLFSHQQGK